MRPLYIFDIDGTIANLEHRLHHIRRNMDDNGDWKPNWNAFFGDVLKDLPIPEVIHTLHSLSISNDIYFFSGRSDSSRYDTRIWLNKFIQRADSYALHMRKHGDHRPDNQIKFEMYDALPQHDKDRLIAVFDDRDQVVNMWRENGVKCFQVAPGDF